MYFSQVWILCIQHTFDSPEKYEPVNTRSWLPLLFVWWWMMMAIWEAQQCLQVCSMLVAPGDGGGAGKVRILKRKKEVFSGITWRTVLRMGWFSVLVANCFNACILFLSQPRCLQSCVSMHKECSAADELCSSVCLRRGVLLLRAVWCHSTKLSSQCSFVCAFWIRLLSEEVGRKLPFELQTGIPVITHFLHSGNPFLLGSMVTNYCLHGVDKLFMLRWFCITFVSLVWRDDKTGSDGRPCVSHCSNISMVCQLVGRLKVKKNKEHCDCCTM